MEQNTILELKHIEKRFPGVLALDDVSIDFRAGEIHCICGENGAGKSTLIKIISGAQEPDKGEIYFEDKVYQALNAKVSRGMGIETVYQELNLVPSLNVAENVFLGNEIKKSGFFDGKTVEEKTKRIFEDMGVDIDPGVKVAELSVAYMQLVEIAKSLAKNARIIIMDEPTAPLTTQEVEILFRLIKRLKERGVTIIYISHRLDELFEIGDRITVMRDGKLIQTMRANELDKDKLIQHMIGRELKESFRVPNDAVGDVVFEARSLYGEGIYDVSFQVRSGEILGLAGLVGAGRTESVRLAFGADILYSGKIFFEGKEIRNMSPQKAVKLGIGLVPEDRKKQGLVLSQPIDWNITLPLLRGISRGMFVDRRKENVISAGQIGSLGVKTPSPKQLAGNLSGGNQQKVVLAKWLANDCKVLILDEPTRGIDVGAKQEIYKLINSLSAQGIAIILISSEMEEILGMSDRINVFHEGRNVAELHRSEFSQERVLRCASGLVS